MKPDTIRKIDLWLGLPATAFLTLFRSSGTRTSKPKKIVFLKFIEQGATVLAWSALKRAVDLVGRENVYFCVFENNRAILDILEIIPEKNIIALNEKSFSGFLSSALSAIRKLRKENVDTAIDMEFFSRASAIFAFMSGASVRVGLHRFNSEQPYRGNLMTHRIQYSPYLHTSVFYRMLVESALQDPGEIPMMKTPVLEVRELPAFKPAESELNSVNEKIRSAFGQEKHKLILLNPNASDMLPLRKWETTRFIELGKKILASHPSVRVIITGAPEEQQAAEEIARQIGLEKTASFAGKTTLRELFTLYCLSDVLVTNDSGPGHFSSMTPIHSVILFGPETPALFGPLSDKARVIWKGLACSPCVNTYNHRFSPCNNNICMKDITVEEVYQEVEKILG